MRYYRLVEVAKRRPGAAVMHAIAYCVACRTTLSAVNGGGTHLCQLCLVAFDKHWEEWRRIRSNPLL